MDQTTSQDRVSFVQALFDGLADDYDQSGVAFFAPIAARLTELLDPRPGERVLDVGCGRGAVTLPLARAVGPSGSVTAVDVAPAMVRHTRDATEAAGLTNVTAAEMDAMRPNLPAGSFDAIASSLVLFFLPDPAAAVSRWLPLLRPGGRLVITTFGDMDALFEELGDLFKPFIPAATLDPRNISTESPFASDGGMERLVTAAGGRDVRTVREPLGVRFADVDSWRAWTMSTGQRLFWSRMSDEERDGVLAAAELLLEDARDANGDIVARQEVRHTLARA
jgi:ubiquinone/menaquinone biosynthesis C-methylase UbiE